MLITLTSEDGKLNLVFDTTRWSLVENYDTLPDVQKFTDSKIDFIALLDGHKLFLIEIKNLRDRPQQAIESLIKKMQPDDASKYDPKNQPIVKNMVDSVKDSLLFMALYTRYFVSNPVLWAEFQQLLANPHTRIIAVLCLETDAEYLPKVNATKLKLYKTMMLQRLKASLEKHCSDVLIVDSSNMPSLPALRINYSI
jgi:hypothetical protein